LFSYPRKVVRDFPVRLWTMLVARTLFLWPFRVWKRSRLASRSNPAVLFFLRLGPNVLSRNLVFSLPPFGKICFWLSMAFPPPLPSHIYQVSFRSTLSVLSLSKRSPYLRKITYAPKKVLLSLGGSSPCADPFPPPPITMAGLILSCSPLSSDTMFPFPPFSRSSTMRH